MDWETYKPIIIAPPIMVDGSIRFLCQDRQLEISGKIVPVLWKILNLCNGYKNPFEIAKEAKLDKNYVMNILAQLKDNKIICDSCEQYLHFHEISNYPAKYFRLLSENELKQHKNSKRKSVKKGENNYFLKDRNSCLYKLQLNRKSCRNFSLNKKLTLYQLGNICDYAYSYSRHSTPSGGGLYPLKLFCIVPYDQIDFKAGYYEYDNEKEQLILFNNKTDIEQLKYCYNDEKLAYNSQVQIIICCDFERQCFKYSNRGYRLSLIEVGQVAQNISLYCEENGLSTCELGGLLDVPLSVELKINNLSIYPVLGIAIGYSSKKHFFNYSNFLSNLVNEYVGKDKPIKEFGINYVNLNVSSFYGAWSKYGENAKRIAGATATSYNEAVSKAIIEGYERYCSSLVRVDYVGPCRNNEYFFAPEDLAPLTDEQRIMWNLSSYKSGVSIEWTKDISGKYYIPTDFVYYGHVKKNKLYLSDSSGIAAYTDYETAKKRALLELIERDAIMKNWYSKESPEKVNYDILPQHAKNRIEYWKLKGRNVHILDLKSKYSSVFLVIIESANYPCFVSGASSILTNFDNAILKALQEAEYNLLLALENNKIEEIKKENIKTPSDHGKYYFSYENSRKISWLWENEKNSKKPIISINDIDKAVYDLGVVFVDLSEKNSSIKVVRAVSKKLLPISFGYKRDYYLHNSLKNVNIDDELPHYFA